jgi:PST family polysaccharide transporter
MIPFDTSGAFRPAAEIGKLRRLAVRGASATVSASGLNLAFQLVSTVIIARQLTPADFGVVTMVTTFSLLLASFGANGFTEVVIQCEEIDRYTASNLFWLNSAAGLVLAVAFAASGAPLARLYRNPLVANVAAAMSVAILLPACSVIHLALLKRAMRFTAASINEVAGRAAYAVVAIVLALRGWGYWALVAGIVASALSTSLGAWSLCAWMPSLPRRTGRTGALIRFAASVYIRFGIGYFRQNVDNLAVGWRFNAAALGFYKKAYDLFALSASQLSAPLHNVAVATLSRLNQDPPRFTRYLSNSLGIIAFVGMAASADLTLVGKDIVRLVLGPQWAEAGGIFVFFGPGIGVMLFSSTVGWIHLSIGRPNRWLWWTILEFIVTALLFAGGLHWGPEGVAIAWSVSFWILFIPAFWYAGRPIGFRVTAFIGAVWRYVAASLLAGLVTAAIVRNFALASVPATTGAALERILSVSTVFVGLYLGVVILLHWSCAPLRQLASLFLELAPTPRPSALRAAALQRAAKES